MNEYYLISNNEQEGPFTLDALKDRAVTPKTKVWKAGMNEWVEAQEITELKDILKQLPPPIPQPAASPLHISAEISRKKIPVFKPGAKSTLANEISANFKLIAISVGLSFLAFPINYIHQMKYSEYNYEEAFFYFRLTFVVSTFLLVVSRYIKMIATWVKQTATR